MALSKAPPDFGCVLNLSIPFPSARLANIALQALSVDEELSPLVQRSSSLAAPAVHDAAQKRDPVLDMHVSPLTGGALHLGSDHLPEAGVDVAARDGSLQKNILIVEYRATTNRMLRVSVNGFFESFRVITASMRELDEDVIEDPWLGEGDADIDNLTRVQGLQEVGVI